MITLSVLLVLVQSDSRWHRQTDKLLSLMAQPFKPPTYSSIVPMIHLNNCPDVQFHLVTVSVLALGVLRLYTNLLNSQLSVDGIFSLDRWFIIRRWAMQWPCSVHFSRHLTNQAQKNITYSMLQNLFNKQTLWIPALSSCELSCVLYLAYQAGGCWWEGAWESTTRYIQPFGWNCVRGVRGN